MVDFRLLELVAERERDVKEGLETGWQGERTKV